MSLKEWNHALEAALQLFLELLGNDDELEREFADSQGAFGLEALAPGAERVLAERRHLEWFVCERPSDHLEGVPVEVLQGPWTERAKLELQPMSEVLMNSIASAFEVAEVEPGGNLLVRDLFGLAEFEFTEPEAASEIALGDLLVGRAFPVSDGLHRLSPAAAIYRNKTLIKALKGDVQRMRGDRGRVLRMHQSELESLFFRSAWTADDGGLAPASAAEAEGVLEASFDALAEKAGAEEALMKAGLSADRAAHTVAEVAALAGGPQPALGAVTELLNELAFETNMDLEVARRVLVELFGRLTAASASDLTPQAPPKKARTKEQDADAAEALRRFDEGRANGEDLEHLFRRLERELGVEEEDGEDTEVSPDFPGVIGAMVEEFLWERGRDPQLAEETRRFAVLHTLSQYGAEIGVFENLGARDLLDYAGRWLLDERALENEAQAKDLLIALAAFCRWCEEGHSHELWSPFESTWKALSEALPRLVSVQSVLRGELTPDSEAYEIAGISAAGIAVLNDDGHELVLPSLSGHNEHLRQGDLIRMALRPEGTFPCRVYPGVLRELIRENESSH